MTGDPLLSLRERRADELDLHVDIHRSAYHPDTHRQNMDEWEAMQDESGVVLRLLGFLDERPVASGSIAAMPFLPEGACILTLAVRPDSRRRGIAKAVYERLQDFARAHALTDVQCTIHEADLHRVEAWLHREGFVEWNRTRLSELQLGSIDPTQWAAAEHRVLEQGFTITTLADEDSETNRHKLWELFVTTHRDVPWGPGAPDMPYEKFVNRFSPPYLLECTVVIRDGDRYVGFTQPMEEAPGVAGTAMTGVLAEYRNRGMGLASKVRCATLLRDRGFTSMRTMNHVGNIAVLGVNTRMGYTPMSELFFFKKLLAPSHRAR